MEEYEQVTVPVGLLMAVLIAVPPCEVRRKMLKILEGHLYNTGDRGEKATTGDDGNSR